MANSECGYTVERTYDTKLIESVMFSPEIWETTAEDGFTQDSFIAEVKKECWVTIKFSGSLIGLCNIHGINSVTCQIHPMVYPEWRGKTAYNAGEQVLRWVTANTKYHKIICEVPKIYRNVILFALSCGFIREGENRLSYLKHGKLHNMALLGITREEIEALNHVKGN